MQCSSERHATKGAHSATVLDARGAEARWRHAPSGSSLLIAAHRVPGRSGGCRRSSGTGSCTRASVEAGASCARTRACAQVRAGACTGQTRSAGEGRRAARGGQRRGGLPRAARGGLGQQLPVHLDRVRCIWCAALVDTAAALCWRTTTGRTRLHRSCVR